MRDSFLYYALAQIPVYYAPPSDHPLSQKEELFHEKIAICNSYKVPPQITSIQNSLNHQVAPNSANSTEKLQAMLTLIKAGYGVGVFTEYALYGYCFYICPIRSKPFFIIWILQ